MYGVIATCSKIIYIQLSDVAMFCRLYKETNGEPSLRGSGFQIWFEKHVRFSIAL